MFTALRQNVLKQCCTYLMEVKSALFTLWALNLPCLHCEHWMCLVSLWALNLSRFIVSIESALFTLWALNLPRFIVSIESVSFHCEHWMCLVFIVSIECASFHCEHWMCLVCRVMVTKLADLSRQCWPYTDGKYCYSRSARQALHSLLARSVPVNYAFLVTHGSYSWCARPVFCYLSVSFSVCRQCHTFITSRICPKGSSAGISFTHGPILGFFALQGRHVAPWSFDLDWFRGGGLRPPKLKKFEFYQYNCP